MSQGGKVKDAFLKHEATITTLGSTVAIIAVIVGAVWMVSQQLMQQQSDYNSKFLQQQAEYNAKFNTAVQESNEKFTKVLEALHKVDKQAVVRDKELEIAMVKSKMPSFEK